MIKKEDFKRFFDAFFGSLSNNLGKAVEVIEKSHYTNIFLGKVRMFKFYFEK